METAPRPLEQRIKDVLKTLADIGPSYSSGLVVFLVDSVLPELVAIGSRKETLRLVGAEPEPDASTKRVHGLVAAEAASLHAPLVADVHAAAADAASFIDVTFAYESELAPASPPPVTSILAMPVLDPDVYQPSPMMRPVIGVVSFGTRATAADLIKNVRVHDVAEQLASRLVVYARTVAAHHVAKSAQTIVVDSHNWTAGEPFGEGIGDTLGREWFGFRPGRFADGSALAEFKSVQSRRSESEQYLRSLKIQAPKTI